MTSGLRIVGSEYGEMTVLWWMEGGEEETKGSERTTTFKYCPGCKYWCSTDARSVSSAVSGFGIHFMQGPVAFKKKLVQILGVRMIVSATSV